MTALTLSASALTVDEAAAACAANGANQTCTNNTATNAGANVAITDTGFLTLTNTATLTSASGNTTITAAGTNITNSSTISNTSGGGDAIDIGVNGAGGASVVFNSGAITALTGGNGSGILTGGNAANVSVTNQASGTISGGYGINHQSANLLSITNFGQITGATNGLFMNSGGGAATINNSGTIRATNAEAINNTSGQLTVTNNTGGLIAGATLGISAATGAIISNYGTISGGTSAVFLNAGNSTFNIYNGSVFTNGIDYNNTAGNTTNFYTGSYTLAVKNYVLGTNTINLRGTGKQLITSGLSGAGTGNIVVVDNSPNTAVVTAAPVAANYASSVINDVLSTTPSTLADIVGTTDLGTGDTVSNEATSGSTTSSGAQAFFPDRKSQKTSRARAAFANVVASSAATGASDALLKGAGQAYDRFGNFVWSRSFGGAHFQDPFGTTNGQRTYAGGTMLGYERREDNWRLGGFFGLARMRTNQALSLDHVTTDTVFGGGYGRYSFGAFNLDGTFSAGSLDATTRRYINNGAEVATGRVRGYFLAPEVALGYNMPIGDGLTFTPTGRLRYTGSFLDGYTETGSTQNVTYGKSVSQQFEERAEFRVRKAFVDQRGLPGNVYVQVAAIAAQRVGPAGFSANLAGNSFTVGSGFARSKVGGSVGLGFNYKLTQQLDLFGSVDATAFTDKSYSLAARAGLKVAF
ncbi:outer membrane autotransporter protein [Rhizobium aquaticum]|uniref:Outer membrane autotransporter protein n=1 Tax=Rhizobium aquaticum TaxID=1549636 RepID=A0ABV2J1V1_9HYPH